MAGEPIKEFLARLGFQVDDAGLKKFNTSLASASLRAAAFGTAIQAAAGAAYAAVYGIAKTESEMLTLSESTGVAVATLEELGFVAEQTGSSTSALNSSIKSLKSNMASSTIGKGSLEAFQRLGVRVKDTNGHLRATDEVLFDVGKRIKDMDRGRQEMFLSQLGIDQTLIKMLTGDVGDLRSAYQEMYAAAGVDAQEAAKDSRRFINTLNTLKTAFMLLAKSVAMGFIKKMSDDMESLRKSVVDNFAKIANILKSTLGIILRVAGFFATLTGRIAQFVGGIIDWFSKLDEGTQTLILGVLSFAAAWRYLNLAFIATPIGAIITGLIALVALVDDFITFMQGGQSLIDWGPWAGQIMEVVAAFQPLLDMLSKVWDAVKGPLFEAFKFVFAFILEGIRQMVSAIVGVTTSLLRLAEGDFIGSWEAFKGGFGFGEDQPSTRPSLAASPAFAAASGGGGQSVNSETNIIVEGSGDPEATARAVGRQQTNVNADIVRNMRGVAR